MGVYGTLVDRQIAVVDLSDFDNRKQEIADELWKAATEIGFFQVKNHSIAPEDIDAAFELSKEFFDLPLDAKQKYTRGPKENSGYEFMSQVRPSTGTKDCKESLQITSSKMEGKWPTKELPDFQADAEKFENDCWDLGMKLLSCFALKLGFEEDFFAKAHNPKASEYQSTLRLIHYPEVKEEDLDPKIWRAGAHTDFDCLTLLFQRNGQGGLQVCPGKDYGGHEWTAVTPSDYLITCNIGDMLMRWSDDKLLSNFHRVASPQKGDNLDERYSIAFFCQANTDVTIKGPQGKYDPISAGDYLRERIEANYAQLKKLTAVS